MELKASAKRRKKGVRGPIGAQGVEVSTRNPKTVTTRLPKGEAQIRKIFFIGIPLHRLSSEQRNELLKNYASLLTEKEAQAFLNAIQRAEAGGPKVVVGGTWGKSRKCRQLISRLTLKGHPKEQGLPDKCFLRTKHGPSTAAGNYQIVYYINWRHLRRLLRLNDFSERNQAIAALELARSSRVKVPGSKVGDGLVALAKGDLKTAIRKGTDPWASSPYSRWRGKHPAPIMKYAQRELKKLQNAEYAKVQTNRFDIGKGDNSAE